jgi:glycosyltransferase involved in cell wall biosynthesis
MRLAIHTQYYPPEMGAPQVRLSELAQRFVERGHEVFVLTGMPNYPAGKIHPGYGGLYRREEKPNYHIVRSYVHPNRSLHVKGRFVNYLSFALSSLVAGTLTLPELDFLFTENPPVSLGLPGFLLNHSKKARWIFNVADLWLEGAVRLGLLHEGRSVRALHAFESFFLRKAWLVTGQSVEILDSIKKSTPGIVTYHLSNGVNSVRFARGRRSYAMRGEIGNGFKCIAIYAGLHGIAQGLDQVVKAAAELRDLRDFCVVFVGDGPEKRLLIEKAHALNLENVRFLESYPNDIMPDVLGSADIALVPLKDSFRGAVPSKLYEAMGAGLPIVMAGGGEAADILGRAQAGIVVSPGNVAHLAHALRDLATDEGKRAELGANGRRAALYQFDRKVIADHFIDFLEKHLRDTRM